MESIFHNANVITIDMACPRVQAVAVEGGRIKAVGADAEIAALRDGHTRVVDCHGGALLPGFIDAHIHLLSYAASLLSIDCSPAAVSSIADIQAAVRRRAARVPAGSWLRAVGYDETALAERRPPTRWELDAAAPGHPVRLIQRTGHASVLNSLALAHAGIGIATEEPPGGYMERDLATGEPSGLLIEMNELLDAVIPAVDCVEMTRAVRQASDNLLAEGVTAIQDATATNGPDAWETFRRLLDDGCLRPAVTLMEGLESLGKLPEEGASGRLRRGPVKIAIKELGDEIVPNDEDLAEMVWQAHGGGRQVAIHAVGQRAVAAAVQAIERALQRLPAGRQGPRPDHRHRIEHCGLCPPALAERIGRLGIAVVSQPSFLHFNGDLYLARVDRADLPHLYPFARLLRAAVSVAAGSDAPVVTPRPLLSIQTAVTRAGRRGVAVAPLEAVDVEQALRMHTAAAAWAAFQEGERGCLSPGRAADFVLLSNDPTALPADEIADLEVEMTVVGGEVAWPAVR